MATKKDNNEVIEIRPINLKTTTIHIVGDSSLIMHAWSEKAKQMMLDAQMGKSKGKKRDYKDPVDDFISSIYWAEGRPAESTMEAFGEALANGARFCFPVTAFKQAAISAAYRMGWVKDKMGLRGAFFIEPDCKTKDGDMVYINAEDVIMREDMVRVGMGTADIRYRGEFAGWSADLKIKYNANGQFSLETILNIINAGGYVCGVGEWRPEKDGQYGMFHIEGTKK